ncbi:MAG: Tn3 family transposase [Chloroflexi bacterium]|nr:Tn3 family transposase [Chloroflexota bacterium]
MGDGRWDSSATAKWLGHARAAIADVVNATLRVRRPDIWGMAMACAWDSKKFGVWDQNLLTEWHIRCCSRH